MEKPVQYSTVEVMVILYTILYNVCCTVYSIVVRNFAYGGSGGCGLGSNPEQKLGHLIYEKLQLSLIGIDAKDDDDDNILILILGM